MSTAPFDRENRRFRAAVRAFVERDVAPAAARCERQSQFPRSIVRACGRQHYLSLDAARTAVFAEELAGADSLGVALSVFVQAGLVGPMLKQLASSAQQREFLAPVESGRLIAAMAVSEAGAGSDFAAITCRAARTTRGFVIDGEKTYITAAAAADILVVAVRLDGALGPDLSLLLVPSTARGVRVTPLPSLGLATTAMGKIAFRKCRVPEGALLGEAGAAYGYIQDALNRERLYGGIGAVAWAARALDRTAAFLRTRRVFGRPLGRFQAVRHQMADVATELEAARQLNYATFTAWQAGTRVTKPIAMIKLFSYAAAQRAIATCLQLHGGLGYLADHWTSRWYRDARALTIAAGTPEVMRDLIAAHLRL
jgi:citronellyl-CoA dehydrogenase